MKHYSYHGHVLLCALLLSLAATAQTNVIPHPFSVGVETGEPTTGLGGEADRPIDRKTIRNGQFIILREGKTYNAQGQMIQ